MIRAEVQPSQTDPSRYDVLVVSPDGAQTIAPLGFRSHALADAVARSINSNADLDTIGDEAVSAAAPVTAGSPPGPLTVAACSRFLRGGQ